MEEQGFNWTVAIGAIVWAVVVAVIGSRLTIIDSWYHGLKKPGWKPPDWSFGVIWTSIFVMSGIALYRGWVLAPDAGSQWIIAILFVINGALNVGWNIFFFMLKRPDWALPETYALIASIIAPALYLYQIDPLAGILMVPYAIWVSVACYLTYEIVRLNAPFPGRTQET